MTFLSLGAAHAQVPQDWKLPDTSEAERAMVICIRNHAGNWDTACEREAKLFTLDCRREGYSEDACEKAVALDAVATVGPRR
jgi:hypothetical protein